MEVDHKTAVIVVLAAAVVFLLFVIVRLLLWNRHTTRKYHIYQEDPNVPELCFSKTSSHLYEKVKAPVCRNEVDELVNFLPPVLLPAYYPSKRALDSGTHKIVYTNVSSSDTEPAASRQISLNSSDIEKRAEQRRASETSTQREADTATRISRSLSQADTEAELDDIAADSSYDGCCLSEDSSRQHKSAYDKGEDLRIGLSDTSLYCVDSAEGAATSHHSVTYVSGSSVRSCRSHARLVDSSPSLMSGYGTSPVSQVSSIASTPESATAEDLPLPNDGPKLDVLVEQSTRCDSFRCICTQTEWCDQEASDTPPPVFEEYWQFYTVFSSAGGVLQPEHSDVLLDIPDNAVSVEKRNTLIIRGAVCTDIYSVHDKLKLPSDEFIRSPVIEYFAGVDYKFQKPVWIVLPHFLSPGFVSENVCVYRFNRSTSGEILIEPLRLQPRQKIFQAADIHDPNDEDTGVYFFGENNTICILTDHFSGYFCTHCKQTHEPPVLILQLFAKHVETKTGGRLVHVRLEVWDNRLNIRDFREEKVDILTRQMEPMDKKRHLPAVENEGDLAEVALGMRLELLTEDDENRWKHFVRQNGEILRPIEETIEIQKLSKCQPAIPYIKDWQLTNRQQETPDDFTCVVDVGYASTRATPIEFVDDLGKETFFIRIHKYIETISPIVEPSTSTQCVIGRARDVFVAPRSSSSGSLRSSSVAMSVSPAASLSDRSSSSNELHDIAADSSCDGCCLTEGPPGQHKSAHDKRDDLWLDLSDTSLYCTDSAEGAANSCHSVKDVPGSSDRSRRSDFRLFDSLPINKGILRKTDSVDSIDSSPTVTTGYGTSLSSQQSSKCSTLESTTPMKLSFPMLAAFAEQSTRSDSFSRSCTHTLTSATQTAWSDVEIDVTSPVFSKEWQICGEFSSAGGVLQGQHSDVMLDIAENTVEKGTRLTIRGAVCTDIESVHETLELPSGEFIRSPVIEYSAGKGYKFQKPVWIVLPHFLPSDFSPENVRVYRFNKGTSGAITVESLRLQPQEIGFQDADLETPIGEDTGVYFFGENNTICIVTDHFSGYLCTHCKQTHEPPVLILQLFAKHVETVEGGRLVHIRLKVWDNRLKIKDFRENTNSIMTRQMQLVDELKHLPRVENEGDLAEVALGMRLELPSEDELQWSHCEKRNGEIEFSVEETIEIKNLCQCQPAIPHKKDWKLTNRQPVTSDFFSCIVDVGYVTCRATPMQFEKTLGFQTFDVRIPKSLEAVCTAAEPLVPLHCVIRRANHVFLSAPSSSSSSSRRPSDVMSESAAASESESVVSGASELSSSVSSSTGDR